MKKLSAYPTSMRGVLYTGKMELLVLISFARILECPPELKESTTNLMEDLLLATRDINASLAAKLSFMIPLSEKIIHKTRAT